MEPTTTESPKRPSSIVSAVSRSRNASPTLNQNRLPPVPIFHDSTTTPQDALHEVLIFLYSNFL